MLSARLRRAKSSRLRALRAGRSARIALLFAAAYIGGNWGMTQQLRQFGSLDVGEGSPIVAPVPFQFWARDLIYPNESGTYRVVQGYSSPAARLSMYRLGEYHLASCKLGQTAARDGQLAAFLFWSRAPVAERGYDGSVLIRDARFYDPRARDRFTVTLAKVRCEPIPTSARPEPVEGRDPRVSGLRQAQPERGGVE